MPGGHTIAYTYVIEVMDACVLDCPSCPVGNMPEVVRTRKAMDVGLFERILAKIAREKQDRPTHVWLFNWGEPLVHPHIGELVRIIKRHGLFCMLSTNFNVMCDLKDVVKAGPDEFKVSMSGFQQSVYGRTHRSGDVNLVKANLHLLRYYMDRYRSKMDVWIGYHLYRHNLRDLPAMRALAASLGFRLSMTPAILQPIEKAIDALEGNLAPDVRELVELMLVQPDEELGLRRRHMDFTADCEGRYNMMSINYDGTLGVCCGVYRQENMLGMSFLDTPHDAIMAARYAHPFCGTCYRNLQPVMPFPAGYEAEKAQLLVTRMREAGYDR